MGPLDFECRIVPFQRELFVMVDVVTLVGKLVVVYADIGKHEKTVGDPRWNKELPFVLLAQYEFSMLEIVLGIRAIVDKNREHPPIEAGDKLPRLEIAVNSNQHILVPDGNLVMLKNHSSKTVLVGREDFAPIVLVGVNGYFMNIVERFLHGSSWVGRLDVECRLLCDTYPGDHRAHPRLEDLQIVIKPDPNRKAPGPLLDDRHPFLEHFFVAN